MQLQKHSKGKFMLKNLAIVLFAWVGLSVANANEPVLLFPSKPITIVVPFTPGGGSDQAARIIAEKFQDAIGQPVLIQNKGGAGGIVGSDHVAKSAADGYTLLLTTTVTFGGVQASTVATNVPFDMYRDFDQVTIIGTTPRAIAVSKKFPGETLADVIKKAKENPGDVSFTASVGSLDELNANVFQIASGTKLNAIYYGSGGSQALPDIMSGRVNLMFDTVPVVLRTTAHTRIVAVSSESRLKFLPDTPTFKELGFKDLSYSTYLGIAVPANTPKEIVKKLNTALIKAINDPAVAEKLTAAGITPVGSSPEATTQMVVNTAKLISRLSEQVKKANTK